MYYTRIPGVTDSELKRISESSCPELTFRSVNESGVLKDRVNTYASDMTNWFKITYKDALESAKFGVRFGALRLLHSKSWVLSEQSQLKEVYRLLGPDTINQVLIILSDSEFDVQPLTLKNYLYEKGVSDSVQILLTKQVKQVLELGWIDAVLKKSHVRAMEILDVLSPGYQGIDDETNTFLLRSEKNFDLLRRVLISLKSTKLTDFPKVKSSVQLVFSVFIKTSQGLDYFPEPLVGLKRKDSSQFDPDFGDYFPKF